MSLPRSEPVWHTQPVQDVLNTLDVSSGGLSSQDAVRRLQQHGPNSLPEAPPTNICLRLLRQFNNTLLIVLMVAAAVTAWMGHGVDTAAIVAVVVLNAVIGFVQEGKAEKALAAIRHLLAPHALVVREGGAQDVPAVELVPGDVVLLASGDSLRNSRSTPNPANPLPTTTIEGGAVSPIEAREIPLGWTFPEPIDRR